MASTISIFAGRLDFKRSKASFTMANIGRTFFAWPDFLVNVIICRISPTAFSAAFLICWISFWALSGVEIWELASWE